MISTPTHPARPRDWAERLHAFIESRRRTPFAWGRHDCCLFVCDAQVALGGSDPAAGLRAYRSARGAQRLLRQHGGLAALASARLGAAIGPLQAQVGDVGLVHSAERDSLALCGGAHWIAPGPEGLVSLPLAEARQAWKAVV